MGLFKKQETPAQQATREITRVKKMSTPELNMWADTILMQLGASFDNYRHHDLPGVEVADYLNAFTAIWEELQRRDVDGSPS